jgi:hypothetical protein
LPYDIQPEKRSRQSCIADGMQEITRDFAVRRVLDLTRQTRMKERVAVRYGARRAFSRSGQRRPRYVGEDRTLVYLCIFIPPNMQVPVWDIVQARTGLVVRRLIYVELASAKEKGPRWKMPLPLGLSKKAQRHFHYISSISLFLMSYVQLK